MAKKINSRRAAVQSIAALLQNAHFKGFFTGKLYTGKLKQVCVPGLNCYSCPGAVGACPIGALQNALSGFHTSIPYYVVGLILFFGAILGRAVCGFLCPFGFIQDLLYKIPFVKKIKTFKGDKILRYLKYIVLITLVIILPLCVKLTPFFCKYLCPTGTLAGILLGLADSKVFAMMGSRFAWKICVLGMIALAGIVIARPFCRYLCPLGAIYAPLNKISLVKLSCDKKKCTDCGACQSVCPMQVNPARQPNSLECIRCGRCGAVCPSSALGLTIKAYQKQSCKNDEIFKND